MCSCISMVQNVEEKGSTITLQFNTMANLSNSPSSIYTPTKQLLKKFTIKSYKSSKHLKTTLIQRIFWMDFFAKNNVSFSNYKSDTCTSSSPTLYPKNKPIKDVCLINPLSRSATIQNKKGAIKFPCLRPLWVTNYWVGLPLTSIYSITDSKPPLIHLTHLSQNPNFHIM